MTHVKSTNKQHHARQRENGAELYETVLRILQLKGSMSVEELVIHLPQFRWIEVLKAVSWLWGEERLELEQDGGRIVVRVLGEWPHLRKSSGMWREGVEEHVELTVS